MTNQRLGRVDPNCDMALMGKVACHPAFAASNIESLPSGLRKNGKERIAIPPVRIVFGRPRPKEPIFCLILPETPQDPDLPGTALGGQNTRPGWFELISHLGRPAWVPVLGEGEKSVVGKEDLGQECRR